MERTAALSLAYLVNQLVANVFVEHTCLNVHVHSAYENERNNVVRHLHRVPFTLFVSTVWERVDERCGFCVLSSDAESMDRFATNRTFNSIIRVLIVADDADLMLSWFERNSLLRDMDVLLVEASTPFAESITNAYRKSRHDRSMQLVNVDLTIPIFEPIYDFTRYTNYHKRIAKISTFHCPVFGSIKNNALADGVETRILREIAEKLNLTLEVVVPRDGKRWGTAYPNKTISGGLLKSLYVAETDVGFCSLWIESSKFPYIDMSGYWEILCLKFLIPKPKVMAGHWNNIFKPLPTNLWSLVMLSAVVTSVTNSALRYAQGYLFGHGRQRTKCISGFITIIGQLVMAKNPDKQQENHRANQHLFLWWSLFAMIITSIYSSSLVSHLTYPEFEPMIDTAEGLVKANFYWGTPYEPPIAHIFDVNNEWHRKFADRFRYEESRVDRVRRIRDGNYSVFVKCIGDVHFMEAQDVPTEILRQLRTSRSCFNYFMLGLGYRKTLPYAEQANRLIRQLVESGVTKYWLDRLFEREYLSTTFAKVYEYKIPPEDVDLQALKWRNLKGVFGLWCVGVASAGVVFGLELAGGSGVPRRCGC